MDGSGFVIPYFKNNTPGPDQGRYFINMRILRGKRFIESQTYADLKTFHCYHLFVCNVKFRTFL